MFGDDKEDFMGEKMFEGSFEGLVDFFWWY